MAILSKTNIIRRIMIGELLINPNKKTLILQCLSNPRDKKNFKEYFDKLTSDPENLAKRKMKIRKIVEKRFMGKTADHIRRDLKKDLKEPETKIVLPILIDDVNPEYLKWANYDLRLGEDVYVTTEKIPRKLNTMGKDGVVSIEPGEFGILMTHEYIFVPPDLMGFISIRLTHKQKGLVNISGFHVDPGFYGRLMFAVFNVGPNDIPLRYKEPVFMIMFNELTGDGPKVKKSRWMGMENIPIETLSGLRGTSVSVRNLHERIRRLEMIFPVVLTGVVSILVAVIAWILNNWHWAP